MIASASASALSIRSILPHTSHTSSDKLFFNITARKEMPINEFFDEMGRAARDMYALFATAETHEPKAKAKL